MTKEESPVKLAGSEKERSGRRGHKKEKVKPPKKIIIRRLPPTMTEEEFLKQIDPLPPHDFYYFAAADWSLGFDATCRAYITLKNEDDVFLFRDRFDGYVFVDSKGAEYPAVVEFAPFQGLLKNKSRRSDNKVNTIEQEPHYQQFLAKLEKDREDAAKGGECKLEFTLDRKKEEKITSTPLLQYLANQKEKRREEAKKRTQEKRRQREEEKEKRRQAQQQQVTKIISGQDAGGGGGNKNASAGGNKSASGKENMAGDKGAQGATEERKNSRSKRREERNQRRREQYEARKRERERERQDGEQRPDAETPAAERANAGSDNKVTVVEQSGNNKQTDDNNKGQQGKESKRYSERRERERERNRNRKEKEREKEKEKLKDKEKGKDKERESVSKGDAATTTASKQCPESNVGESAGETVVNETVLNFIRSAASAKEFVPKKKQQEQQQKQEDAKQSAEDQVKASEPSGSEDKRTQRQKSVDEQRRIRNKDRPSIAIYQPKARLRLSEEREGSTQLTGSKTELRSNPTSDSESVKREETRSSKKVSRYSERRAERRNNREKQIADNLDASEKNPRELRKSKSCENENSIVAKEINTEKETAQSGEC